jgi:glycosyltransferase involved in cell wall biosynthesis
MKKKICIFCSLSSFDTGMPISTYKLAAGLAGSGRFDVRAALPSEGALAERLRGAGVGVRVIPFRRVRNGFINALCFLSTYFRAGLALGRFIRKNNIDIAHFSDVIDAPFYPWARLAGAKVAAHVRVCVGGRLARYFFRLWARVFCNKVITVSNFAKRYYGFGKRAAVVYNPGPDRALFDPEKFSGLSSRNSILPDESSGLSSMISNEIPTVITVSMFRREKGHHNFLEIAARIKERVAGNVRFVIIGGRVEGHEGYYDEVMAKAARLGLDGCLTVTGSLPHEAVPAMMAGAAALLHVPDWEEALGGVALEAMAMGVVPVAYDCGGVGECFTDGVSGFLVRRGDFEGAAEKAVSLLESSELRQRMALSARRELDEKFTLKSYIGNVEKIYDEIYTGGGAA